MDKSLQFEVQRRLETGDLGEDLGGGFRMADIGGSVEDTGSPLLAPPVNKAKPKNRKERRDYADSMAGQLMDWYMKPEVLNDPTMLNPIRDGIPQCTEHRFVKGSATEIGCIHGCGNRERDGGGNLPVAKDYTVADVWTWVRAIVRKAVERHDTRTGLGITPNLTPGR